jgi:hypothetical protein
VALTMLVAVAGAACSPTATPIPTDTPDQGYSILPTPWAGGTIGQYGLRIDPSLLNRLPRLVGARQLTEDAFSESIAMDDQVIAQIFQGYAAANIGSINDDNWLDVAAGVFKPDLASPGVYADSYQSWVDQYAASGCSQAGGVTNPTQETISGWIVDEATCGGGPVVYTMSLGHGTILSMTGFGSLDLGRKLIEGIYT